MSNNQTRVNLYTNIATMVANTLVVIYYTPYLVDKLGVSVYGVLPLALIINQYIMVATGMLTNAFTRFYSVAIQKNDYGEASKVFTTSLVATLFIIIIITPALAGVVLKVDTLFQIPRGFEESARWLFSLTIVSFYFSIVSSFLNVTLYALNRLDLMNYMKIVRQSLKLVFTVFLFEGVGIELHFVGLANLIVEIIVFFWSIYYFFKYKPVQVKISLQFYSKITLFAILGMASWVLIQELGDTLLYRTDNILINHYLGSSESGRLGAISELGGYIKTVVQVVGSLFGPLILIAYAKDNHKEVEDLTVNQSLIVGCLAAVLCGVTAGVGPELLSLWLDDSFLSYSHWLCLKLFPIPFYAAGGVMSFVYKAWNKVKKPAIYTLMIGFIDIIVLLAVCQIVSIEQMDEAILCISCIFSLVQSYLLGLYCVYKIYPGTKNSFIRLTGKLIIVFVISFFIAYVGKSYWKITGFTTLCMQCMIYGILSFVILIFILNKEERLAMINVYKR